MKKIIIFLITINLFALNKNTIYSYHMNGDFKATCKFGMQVYKRYIKDEDFLSIIGLDCVKVDRINNALTIAKYLRNSPLARNNASYISSLFLIKKLLMQLAFDNIDLSNLSLPKSDNILSIVFESISHNQFKKINNIFVIKKGNIIYTLSPSIDYNNNSKIIIKKFIDNSLIEIHKYN